MSTTSSNWMDPKRLGLSDEEDKEIRECGQIFQAVHLVKTPLDTALRLARAIKRLRDAHYGSGERGAYGDALVQYGFTDRTGEKPVDESIRNSYEDLRTHEAEVRAWWATVPEQKKRHWMSARAIHRQWKKWKKAQANPQPEDPDTGPELSQWAKMRNVIADQARKLNEQAVVLKRLRDGDGGNVVDPDCDPAEIAPVYRDAWRHSPNKLKRFITLLQAELKQLEAAHKAAQAKADIVLAWQDLGGSPNDKVHHSHRARTSEAASYLIEPVYTQAGKFSGYGVRLVDEASGHEAKIGRTFKTVKEAKKSAEEHYRNGKAKPETAQAGGSSGNAGPRLEGLR